MTPTLFVSGVCGAIVVPAGYVAKSTSQPADCRRCASKGPSKSGSASISCGKCGNRLVMALRTGEEDTDGVHGVEQTIEAVGVEVVDEREGPLVRSLLDLAQQAPTLGSE